MQLAKPIFRWAGSKRKLISRLASYWSEEYDRYVEPFAGSSCLFFAINPTNAVLADKNSELIDAYEIIRDRPVAVLAGLRSLKRSKPEYYRLRAIDPGSLARIPRAVRFLFLNRNCFNGLFRTNLNGHFNVPFASKRVASYLSDEEFLVSAKLLRKATLRAWDFGTTLRNVKKGDFVYLDPPYAVESRRVFREYDANPFSLDDLSRLSNHLNKIHDRGVDFVVSYADCREARELGRSWNAERLRVRRHIAGFTGDRRHAFELLITNIVQNRRERQ